MIVKTKTAKHKSAGIIASRTVNHDLEFLFVLSRWSRRWGFPKGHAEIGESVLDTAIREAQEETGMLFRISPTSQRVNINKTTYYLILDANLNCENYSFTPKPIDTTEIMVCRWMTLQHMDYIKEKFPERVTRDIKLFLSKNYSKQNVSTQSVDYKQNKLLYTKKLQPLSYPICKKNNQVFNNIKEISVN